MKLCIYNEAVVVEVAAGDVRGRPGSLEEAEVIVLETLLELWNQNWIMSLPCYSVLVLVWHTRLKYGGEACSEVCFFQEVGSVFYVLRKNVVNALVSLDEFFFPRTETS